MFLFSLIPLSKWNEKFPSILKQQRTKVQNEARLILLFWVLLMIGSLSGVPGMAWIFTAGIMSHLFLGLWLSAEHTGLSYEGTIINRTRTVKSNAIVRFFLWNTNYHAEHHAWPFIPWYKLPKVHALVSSHLENVTVGYLSVHYNVIKQRQF